MGSTSKRSVYSESRPRDPVRGALIDASRAYGINLRRFVAVAKCESSLDPNARSDSGAYLGVMQQHRGYWPARAARAGFRGASPFDPRANVFTAAHMIRHGGGWGHWQTCSRGGRA
jgi:soluble lytic murein transglycosylase-like protein